MILFNLLTLDAQQARAATQLILTERLATDVFVDEAIANYHLEATTGELVNRPLYRVMFLTKALLYRDIELVLQAGFPANDFRCYATAITQVNDCEADRVRQLIRRV